MSERIGPRTFLIYERLRWLKAAGLLLVVAIAAYVADKPLGGRSGGSWLGLALGGVSFALILWLMWFGVRRRSFHARGAPLRGWLSAHVYLGAGLLVLVPLHSAFQFGWNVHTLAFALMVATIATGFLGILFYTAVPTPMTRNRSSVTMDALLAEVASLDAQCGAAAAELPDFFAQAVGRAITETRIGGGMFAQLRRVEDENPTARALAEIQDHDEDLAPDERDRVRQLLELLSSKEALVARIQRDIRYKALLDLWLIFHVPLAFGTVAAVLVHVFVVLYYR